MICVCLIFLSQLPNGTVLTAQQEPALRRELLSCTHRGSRRRCCPDLWICLLSRQACIPATDFDGVVGTGVQLCRDCAHRTPMPASPDAVEAPD